MTIEAQKYQFHHKLQHYYLFPPTTIILLPALTIPKSDLGDGHAEEVFIRLYLV